MELPDADPFDVCCYSNRVDLDTLDTSTWVSSMEDNSLPPLQGSSAQIRPLDGSSSTQTGKEETCQKMVHSCVEASALLGPSTSGLAMVYLAEPSSL